MVLQAFHPIEEWILSYCLEARLEGAVDEANVGVVGFFLCVCLELAVLTLVAEWSSWATCPTVIASKPLRPNPGSTFVVEKFVMHVGGER
jgi:hypothetical protein